MIHELTMLFADLHPFVKVVVVGLSVLLILAILKRLVKLGILVAILLILIFVFRSLMANIG